MRESAEWLAKQLALLAAQEMDGETVRATIKLHDGTVDGVPVSAQGNTSNEATNRLRDRLLAMAVERANG